MFENQVSCHDIQYSARHYYYHSYFHADDKQIKLKESFEPNVVKVS